MSEKKPSSFLIVCFRYIGDVLVTTPLALSIKTARPDATVDYLVFEGTEKAIAKNPHIDNIITVPKQGRNLGTLLTLLRRYDMAVAAYPSDRTAIAAAFAGRRSIGLTYDESSAWWKRCLLGKSIICDDRRHVVSNMLSLAEALGVVPIPRVSMGFDEYDVDYADAGIMKERYMLLHPYSLKRCKYWPAENWGMLAALIHEYTNCTAVFTVTPAAGDKTYLEEILSFAPPETMTFPCTLNQFAAALRDCTAYIGIDTAATHIAAAIGVPTIALYGPTLTRYWAPWPNGCKEQSPFAANKSIQRKGSVTVVQKDWDCVPCNRETCSISTRSRMECLEELTPAEVFREVLDNVKRHHTE